MTQFTMRVQISGTRDGVDWPPIGGQIDLPESEGEQLVKMGAALPGVVKLDGRGNPTEPLQETATAPVPEKATAKRSNGSTKKALAEVTEPPAVVTPEDGTEPPAVVTPEDGKEPPAVVTPEDSTEDTEE